MTEVPLLYETGGDERFDKVVVITAPKALREARREPLPGDRETRLIDDKEKAKRADYAYVNTGSLEELDEFVAVRRSRSDGVRRLVIADRARRRGGGRRRVVPARDARLSSSASATRSATRRSCRATRATTASIPRCSRR